MLDLAKLLLITGLIFIFMAGIFLLAAGVPWFGKLPGDIMIKRENFTFYFPITTCILASIILSVIIYLLFKNR
ncbi:MAG: DUF2905 domain-containing protein [Candidatus Omnitrophica bacterium]|nr:DUF2905 domain-containing protein [Candidatus Omnitrophota bacterium]